MVLCRFSRKQTEIPPMADDSLEHSLPCWWVSARAASNLGRVRACACVRVWSRDLGITGGKGRERRDGEIERCDHS